MSEIKRYGDDWILPNTFDGEYVRYDDHLAATKALRAELAEANADRCYHDDADPACKLEHQFIKITDHLRANLSRRDQFLVDNDLWNAFVATLPVSS